MGEVSQKASQFQHELNAEALASVLPSGPARKRRLTAQKRHSAMSAYERFRLGANNESLAPVEGLYKQETRIFTSTSQHGTRRP